MATTFEVVLPYGTAQAWEMGMAAFDVIDRLEAQLTVYRESSEVCRLNRLAPVTDVPVEERLFGLLELAQQLTESTDGAFDITSGALIKAWGFFRGPRRVPSEEERKEALARVGMRNVCLNSEGLKVRYLCQGLEINLGSIGKGYTLDQVAALLRDDWQQSCALLHAGYSSVVAIGSSLPDQSGWTVGIRHPWDPERRLALVHLRNRALATSAATFQYLEYNNRKLGHILDPRTGWPADGVASASVLAPTGAEADALSTAFFVLGIDAARRYCETHPGVGAILLPDGENAEPVVLGLAAHEVTLPSSPQRTPVIF
jgi:thiamine biosynthesis lipoprotein